MADPAQVPVPTKGLLDKAYCRERATLIDPTRALADVVHGAPVNSSDTVYFTVRRTPPTLFHFSTFWPALCTSLRLSFSYTQVTDDEGNACSFINSNYMGFGTGLVPENCGFTLQNRGANFVIREGQEMAAYALQALSHLPPI